MPLGMIIEGLVAVLLLITIGYCWMLNKRLQRLRADEQVLRATISELMTATEIAERAILGLKSTAADADKTLGTRLKQAETMSHTLADQLGEGERVFTRISQIAEAARSAMPQRESTPRGEAYAVQPPETQPGYAPAEQAYAPAAHYPGPVTAEHEPDRKRSRTSDIRSAAAEATARLEEFRRRKGAAA
ncbi:chemotaxis protein [Labrenzia sp. 011]|nr:chemotaxis protein [Labrenzia sp. 011]